jgi:hypothetical protein
MSVKYNPQKSPHYLSPVEQSIIFNSLRLFSMRYMEDDGDPQLARLADTLANYVAEGNTLVTIAERPSS